ncbi:hypothetical protein DFH29DRAFT_1067281 [Suillus ampliporus]|nr:hypothetical protein DFH29DRAFT_1067281 [Suillus ampliporus]
MSTSWQTTQTDALLRLNVEFIAESRWGLGTFLYLACSHLPFAYLLLDMLIVFQPDAPFPLCRSYIIATVYIELLIMICAECIFLFRAYAVWERERWPAVFAIVTLIVYLVPIIVCLQKITSSLSGKCWIPGAVGYLDMEIRSRLYVVYCLLAVAELHVLLFLLYPIAKDYGGWESNNRLARGLMLHNLLYCGCGFAFSLSVVLTTIFLPFPVAHLVTQFVHSHLRGGDDHLFGNRLQVVVQTVLVTRMHRDFWKSDRASCGVYAGVSLTTWMAATPDII